MFLTKEEEEILDGELGEGHKKAMELLVALGDIKGADKFVDIERAHVSGVSYLTIGDPGLELLEEWASTGVKAGVLTTTNPVGLDLEAWQELGFPERFALKQGEILRAYETMGVRSSCTCTPYLTDNVPKRGEHIAWAESNAVAYSNSVLGARTNRESGISALSAAILGKVPNYGLHLDENRRATSEIIVDADLEDPFDYSAMGFCIGQMGGGIP
ncbi:MAG: aconitase X, partial [Candidatus Hydrothermarchaeales archaeon]